LDKWDVENGIRTELDAIHIRRGAHLVGDFVSASNDLDGIRIEDDDLERFRGVWIFRSVDECVPIEIERDANLGDDAIDSERGLSRRWHEEPGWFRSSRTIGAALSIIANVGVDRKCR
jgi:hypothetical protein